MKVLNNSICLVCGVEFDPTPQPMILDYFGRVIKWWRPPHFHETTPTKSNNGERK